MKLTSACCNAIKAVIGLVGFLILIVIIAAVCILFIIKGDGCQIATQSCCNEYSGATWNFDNCPKKSQGAEICASMKEGHRTPKYIIMCIAGYQEEAAFNKQCAKICDNPTNQLINY